MIKNPPNLAEAIEANLRTGVSLLINEALVTAINDRRLERAHLLVLAAIAAFMTGTNSPKAWPGRDLLAELTGLSVKTVSNTLVELRAWGYVIAGRQRVEEAADKNLTVYTFGNIDHEGIKRQIEIFVARLKAKRDFPARGEQTPPEVPRPRGSSPPAGNSDFPARGELGNGDFPASGEVPRPRGNLNAVSSPPAGRSIINNNIPPSESAPPSDDADATRSRKRDTKPRVRLKADWQPSPETVAWARDRYVATDQQIFDQAEKFRDYHVSKGSVMADWPAAWRTWWNNGFHKIPKRMSVRAELPLAANKSQEAFEEVLARARRLDEEAEC